MNTQHLHQKNLNNDDEIIIVTGLSGAGKTSFMRSLEDINFYCVDNLPIPLLSAFLDLSFKAQPHLQKIALGIDARSEQFLPNFICEINRLKTIQATKTIKIIFLNAHEETLLKRYQETRRKHPLANDTDILSAIRKEKALLDPILNMADMILDTDKFNIHELRHWTQEAFSDSQKRKLCVNLISFGFKYGVPPESNLVYDLRFLPNPHFVPELKKSNGLDASIQEYLFARYEVTDYWNRLTTFLHYSLQQFYIEGLFFITVAIGCTGGKHRSTAFVEKLSKLDWEHVTFLPHHRDLGKE
ncbi:MAG: RNase adapter RapZ [bacterium]